MILKRYDVRDKMFLMSDATIDIVEFPDWLRIEREKHNWTQSDLGRESGLGRGIINKLESGSQKPTFYNCVNLADALDMDLGELLIIAKLVRKKPGQKKVGEELSPAKRKLLRLAERADDFTAGLAIAVLEKAWESKKSEEPAGSKRKDAK